MLSVLIKVSRMDHTGSQTRHFTSRIRHRMAGISHLISMIRKAHVDCNFICLVETGNLFKVTVSHVYMVMSLKRCKAESLLL